MVEVVLEAVSRLTAWPELSRDHVIGVFQATWGDGCMGYIAISRAERSRFRMDWRTGGRGGCIYGSNASELVRLGIGKIVETKAFHVTGPAAEAVSKVPGTSPWVLHGPKTISGF